ncbi:hypothetical protein Poli38472_011431 [Pythium oligandrum]|uniref:BZIP domain-containing protein n=1 Tax=Pythium oligandrum TaxID=41045 RepID=A0A8K1CJ42_PYTOL|nr:hypothetical protein Poli38472_011431 [Pythium oligandrum]|eukprot:TMW64551.1 hypothetical protein Poli38472_011431 [Pythium oligandrum]
MSPSSTRDVLPHDWTETDQEIMETLLLLDGVETPPPSHRLPHELNPSTIHVIQPARTSGADQAFGAGAIDTGALTSGREASNSPHSTASDEERRAKHREVQRRFIRRKKEQMRRVREQLAELEKQFSFLQLTKEALALEKENGELCKSMIDTRCPSDYEINLVLEREIETVRERYCPLSDEEYDRVLKSTMLNVDESSQKMNAKGDQDASFQIMNWRGRHILEHESNSCTCMRFDVSKAFEGVSLSSFADKTWQRICNPDSFRQFFSSSLRMKFVILQHIKNDAIVLYRTFFNPSTGRIMRAVELVLRIRREHEEKIVLRCLEMRSLEEALGDIGDWCRALNIIEFSPRLTPEERTGLACRYSGYMRSNSAMNLRFWLLEVLFIVIRFESIMLPWQQTLVAREPTTSNQSDI